MPRESLLCLGTQHNERDVYLVAKRPQRKYSHINSLLTNQDMFGVTHIIRLQKRRLAFSSEYDR